MISDKVNKEKLLNHPTEVVGILLFLIGLFVFVPYYTGKSYFWLNIDQEMQYREFYYEWKRLLVNFVSTKEFPLYSFRTYLGNSFFAAKSYYVTGDLMFLILSPFMNVDFALISESFICLVCSGIFFSLFLKEFGIKNSKYIILISIIYSFSGISSLYLGQYMFHRFIAFAPLIFYSIECIRNKHKEYLLPIVTFILFMFCYYFMFPTCIFLFIYAIFSLLYHSNDISKKGIFQFYIKCISLGIIGVLMASVLLIPTILFLLENPRVGNNEFSGLIFPLRTYLGYFISYITGVSLLDTNYPNLFQVGSQYHLYWYSLYTGAITLPILLGILCKRQKTKSEKMLIILWLLLNCSALIPFVASIWHGFSEPSFRWTFLLVIFNLLIVSVQLEKEDLYKEIEKGNLWTIFGIIVSVFILNLIGYSFSTYKVHFTLILFDIVLIFIYRKLFKIKKKNIVLVLTTIECLFCYFFRTNYMSNFRSDYPLQLDSKQIQYLADVDDSLFFRTYIDSNSFIPSSEVNMNQSLTYGYKSTSTYDSTFESSLLEFNHMNDQFLHIISINDVDVLRMLGVKYFYVLNENDLPSKYTYTYVNDNNLYHVYKLNENRPLGFTYSKFTASKPNDFNEELFVTGDVDISNITPTESVDFNLENYYGETTFVGKITVDNPQILFFSIPYSSGWRIMNLDTNEEMKVSEIGGGFLGVKLDSGTYHLKLSYFTPGLKLGVLFTAIGILMYFLVCIYYVKKNKKYNK